MIELIESNWPLVIAALVVGVLVAWYVFHAGRRTRVTGASRDVLDDGAERAARNSALIDAAPAAPQPAVDPVAPAGGPAGAGTPAVATGDDLARIKGIGPKLAARLRELGVTGVAQIAAWSESDIDRIDAQLGRFEGRIRRDDWVGQARLLDAGDAEGYAARYGSQG